MSNKKPIPAIQTVISYMLTALENNSDSLGIQLTNLDEDIQEHFELTDEQYSDADFSYEVFSYLARKGLV